MAVAERGDGDAVREVEICTAGCVEQAMAHAVAPASLEIAAQDGRQVLGLGGQIGDGCDGFLHRPSIGLCRDLRLPRSRWVSPGGLRGG